MIDHHALADLVATFAIGLVLVLEGLLWAIFPWMATKLLETAATTPENALRAAGAGAVAGMGRGLAGPRHSHCSRKRMTSARMAPVST